MFTPEAAPSPPRSGQIYPKSQGQVVLVHRIPVGETNQEPRTRYSSPTFSECLQPVWLPYGGGERSRLTIHLQRLPGTLLDSTSFTSQGPLTLSGRTAAAKMPLGDLRSYLRSQNKKKHRWKTYFSTSVTHH